MDYIGHWTGHGEVMFKFMAEADIFLPSVLFIEIWGQNDLLTTQQQELLARQ
jgi:hypothetical protein